MRGEQTAVTKLVGVDGEGVSSTERSQPSGIVVGVDGSAEAAAAIHWAVDQAEVRGCSLTAVLAWGLLEKDHPAAEQPLDTAPGETDALAALNAIIANAVEAHRARTIVRKVVRDSAVPALINASRESDLLVVGARGLGGSSDLLLGSVSLQCLDHARCPVAIVRDDMVRSRSTARIVVGVDGSATSARALEWAVEVGRLHRSSIEAVHAWETYSTGVEAFAAIAFDPTPPIDAARAMMDVVLGAIDTDHHRASIAHTEAIGSLAKAILRASEGADLVVVGSIGLDPLKGRLIGSVALQVVHNAKCPVVVVPPQSRVTRRRRRRRKPATTPA